MRAPRGQEGMTLIELVVGISITILVMGALAMLFVHTNDSSFSSQRAVSRVAVVEGQIERIRQAVKQYGFSALALTAAPATGGSVVADPTDPDAFVSGSSCSQTFTVYSNYNETDESPGSTIVGDNPEPLVVNGCTLGGSTVSGGQIVPLQYVDVTTGAVASTLTGLPAGDPYATVNTFVTQTTTAGCNTSLGSCTGDVRRVIVAVTMDHPPIEGSQFPTYATTLFANPTPSNSPGKAKGLTVLGLIS
jgi:type II secretory pathway pseudopilin PulG